MPRLTLRTLLAYIDDTLEPNEARDLGKKVADSAEAKHLVERIKRVTRRRGLAAPDADDEDDAAGDPNTVAEYLDNALDSPTLKQVEETCLESDVHLAEVAACHQILTLVLTEPVRVPPRAHRRMYELVQPPASVPSRRPNRTLPVSATAPLADGATEPDDADAALLFGMKRYSATTWATRFALLGATAALLVVLAGAVYKSLSPPADVKAPEVAKGNPPAPLYADARPVVPEPPPAPKKEPAPPVPPVVPPKDKADAVVGKKEPGPVAVKPKDMEPAPLPRPVNVDKWDELPPPSVVRDAIGRIETDGALVVRSRPRENMPPVWDRQPHMKSTDANNENAVFSADPVMALPGYKANVLLGPVERPTVDVLLWGNVPEQLAYRVLESKVIFHQPPAGFDADLTLLAGRAYVKSVKQDGDKKPLPAKVRVRLANREMWDITLPGPDADAMVELISWYQPGKAGVDPKREARVAVVRGPVGFQTSGNREKKFDKIDGGAEVRWDSASNTLSEPTPSTNIQEISRVPTLDGLNQKALAAVLADMAKPGIISVVLSQRLEPEPGTPNRDLVARVAIYSWAALADSTADGADALKQLVKILNSGLPWLSRQAAITALVQWVGRERDNTKLLGKLLNDPDGGIQPPRTADAVLEMLRGYISPTEPDPARLDELLSRLAGVKQELGETRRPPAIAVREVALWNLASADTGLWIPPPFIVNVGAVDKFDSKEYEGFLNDWRKRVEAIKQRTKKP